MKKFICILLGVLLAVFAVGCDSGEEGDITLMAPDGAPALAAASIFADGTIGGRTVNSSIVAGADEISTNVANGTADIAIMPVNLAARIYNGGAKIKLVSVSVTGCLYMVGKSDLASLSDLKGKIVYNIGRGATPDITLKYILNENGVEYVESDVAVEGKVALQYVSAASELVPMLKAGVAEYGIMGEPAVTNCNKVAGTKTVLDVQAEWEKIVGNGYTQACLVVSEKIAGKKAFMNALTDVLSANLDWCKANADGLKTLLKGKGSALSVDFTPELIDRANVCYLPASEVKQSVESYRGVLMGFNPNLIGGKLPDSGFYYGIAR